MKEVIIHVTEEEARLLRHYLTEKRDGFKEQGVLYRTVEFLDRVLGELFVKPDEPKGLGAVVEDAKGDRWTQVGVGCWVAASRGLEGFGFGEFDAVRVLSEGVQ